MSVLSFSGLEARIPSAQEIVVIRLSPTALTRCRGRRDPAVGRSRSCDGFLIQRGRPDVWRVIILFSDGDDTISKASFHEVWEKILASEAQIYAIDLSPPGPASNGTAILQRIADDSGGRRIRSSDGAVGIFRGVIDDLHSARVVTYALPKSGSDFHSIRILPTHNLKLQFRCRRGYYYRSAAVHTSEDSP